MNLLVRTVFTANRSSGFTCFALIVTSCSIFLTSCSHYFYCPNSNNTPLLSENEAKINIQYAAADEINAFELQSAFAVSPHIGGMVNMIAGGGNGDNSAYGPSGDKGNGKIIEAGAGYFSRINTSSIIWELYGGIGTGGINNNFGSDGSSKVNFTKLFLQPDIGIKVKGFELGISSRFSFVKHKVKTIFISSDSYYYENIIHIQEHPNSFLWEPGLALRVGGKNLLFQLQYTFSINITNPELIQEEGIFNMGFSIPIKYSKISP